MEGGRISPIVYIEARCDECNDEIYSGLGVEFALLRNGGIICNPCGYRRPDDVLKWFSIAPLPEPEEETPRGIPIKAAFRCNKCTELTLIDQTGKTLQHPTECPACKFTVFEYVLEESVWEIPEPDAIDRAREEQIDRK